MTPLEIATSEAETLAETLAGLAGASLALAVVWAGFALASRLLHSASGSPRDWGRNPDDPDDSSSVNWNAYK